jgi:glycosyltransferase involved in cell wall biosynthesis
MKILYLCPDLGIPALGRKGASVHVRAMVTALAKAGHSVILAASVLNKSPWEEPAYTTAQLLPLVPEENVLEAVLALKAFNETLGVENSLPGELRRILHNQDLVSRLKRRFENDPPDFIYERASIYATAGISLAQALKRPILVELNAPLAIEQSAYRATGLGELAAQAELWLLSRADAVLTVSTALKEYVVSLGIEPRQVYPMPNCVDSSRFKPKPRNSEVRGQWGLGDEPVLGFVGGLRPWHGVEVLPTLLDRLRQRHSNLHLVIVGNGPLQSKLECGLRERGLMQRVIFTGSVSHEKVAEMIPQFDVALAPYPQLEHAFYFSPLKIFEYMACGVPLVAAELGQIGEVVRNGETGFLYPPGDLDALTTACNRLLGDSDLRRQVGQAAAREVHSNYTWNHNAARVVELARSLIAAKKEIQ